MYPTRKALFFFHLRVYNENLQRFASIIADDYNDHSNLTNKWPPEDFTSDFIKKRA